ncbi:MAG TPA: competence protein ComEC, partial [Xanthobacteraceae bacterium]|nr:competence protein ComEC [Xanthobacteraceae bacterium]
IAALPHGGLLSVVTAVAAFEEDCVRAAVLVSALAAPADCQAQVFDREKLAATGAVGLTWNGSRYLVATDRSVLEDRPWSAAPALQSSVRTMPPPSSGTPGADPADP